MNGMEFLEKLEQIDPAYLTEAEQASSKKRRFPKWGIALAACLALLVGVGAALTAAGSGSGTRLLSIYTARPKEEGKFLSGSGYVIELEAERFPLSNFTGEVQDAGNLILSRSPADVPEDSSPDAYKRDFATAQEALDYIGFAALKNPDMELEETYAFSTAFADPSGRLTSVSFAVNYYPSDALRMYVTALMFTEYSSDFGSEHFPEDLSEGASGNGVILFTHTSEDVSYAEDFYTTATGSQCQVLESTAMEDGYHRMSGWIVADGIVYSATVFHLTEDTDQAMELLHRWADQL